jgi:hypothetical protein
VSAFAQATLALVADKPWHAAYGTGHVLQAAPSDELLELRSAHRSRQGRWERGSPLRLPSPNQVVEKVLDLERLRRLFDFSAVARHRCTRSSPCRVRGLLTVALISALTASR